MEKRFQKQPPQQVVNVIESPWPTPQIVELVHGMVWRLVRCDGPSFFLTSDNPGFFFEGEGLGSLSAELILPIATNRLLHCSWQEDKDEASVHLVPEKVVKVFNQRTAGGADRYVYYHAKKSWVLEVAKNKVEQMSRINWT